VTPLAEVVRIIRSDPARAEILCREILAREPTSRDAKLMLAEALRLKGNLPAARAEIEPLAASQLEWFPAQRVLGLVLNDRGKHRAAADTLRRAAKLNPSHIQIWRELGDASQAAGDAVGAQNAYLRHTRIRSPVLTAAAKLLGERRAIEAARVLAEYLDEAPTDLAALTLNADVQLVLGRPHEAELSLRRALDLAPAFGAARTKLTQLLMGVGRAPEALAQAGELVRREPRSLDAKQLYAVVLVHLADYEHALATFEAVLDADPQRPPSWVGYGHVLKTIGRGEEGAAAYRRALAIAPKLGEAWWSLANLKTWQFSDDDVAAMQTQLQRPDLTRDDRVAINYALGKAFEDRGDTQESFANYAAGAKAHRDGNAYDAGRWDRFLQRSRTLFTSAFFAARAGFGDPRPDPIFIVGMPRSGSTLVEQILASHSQIEGTAELQDLPALTLRLGGPDVIDSYLDHLESLNADVFQKLGAQYLASTQSQRKTGRPLFTDKTPNNFLHIGLIHLILPNSKIVDVRRHPLACGWSCFKQLFAQGQNFSYDLSDLGRFYANYARIMAHYDAALPGRVYRVNYEALVSDPESEIRKLLAYCGSPFEGAVLRPHETKRAVRTPSAEQVRRPISAEGLDDWKPYKQYLQPLKDALGEWAKD
jgi:tetratricopeptide (TPR) repeat protein